MHGQRFLHPLSQTPRRARIEIHEFAMQRVQGLLGGRVIFQCVRRVQFLRYRRLLFIRQMIEHVAPLVNLAALDRSRLAGMLFHRRRQCLPAIQNVKPRLIEIESAVHQIAQEFADQVAETAGTA